MPDETILLSPWLDVSMENPNTIECRVLYDQDQELNRITKEILEKMYPQDADGTYPMANRDFHTMYVGEIVDTYIIR